MCLCMRAGEGGRETRRGTEGLCFCDSTDSVILQMTFSSNTHENRLLYSCVYSIFALTCTAARCPFLNRNYIRALFTVPIYIRASEENTKVVVEHLTAALNSTASEVTSGTMTSGRHYI